VQAPIRSEIFGQQRFAQHGRSLGATHRAERGSALVANFFPRLRSNMRTLREAHRYISHQALTGYDISPAAEWLLDNFHLIEAQIGEIHEGLPRSYFRTLPILQDEPLAGLPRVYGIAWAFVAHTDSAFEEDLYIHFLSAYEEARELNLSELWAMPTTLRVVLVENLRRLAERVATNKAAREIANLCADGIERYSVPQLDALLDLLNQRGVNKVFLAQLALRLLDRPSSADGAARYLEWIHAVLPDLASVQAQQPADQAADNLSLSNAVKSLRSISAADWSDIVDRSSALMRLMLTSPLFEAEDTATRDQTLHRIQRIARQCDLREVTVAQGLLAMMKGATAASAPGAVAGYWLVGDGRQALCDSLGVRVPLFATCKRRLQTLALPIYLCAVFLGTVALVATIVRHPGGQIVPMAADWFGLLALVLMVFPASEALVAVINRLISESVKPEHLPRLALANGLELQHQVIVAIPALLTSLTTAKSLAHRLSMHYLANPERHAQFALLTDWTDAPSAQQDSDKVLLDEATRLLETLNRRYSNGAREYPLFILLHRQRTYSDSEQAWIGWERKRGKLAQLAEALTLGNNHGFIDLGEMSRIAPGTKYILTLDSDTQLPPGNLRELIGVAVHPQNHPSFDPGLRRVVSGYGILQPRVVTPLPGTNELTLFHWLFAGQPGIDAYSAASSEVYQDVFGEGTFTGKGLLNVDAMHKVLAGRLPDGKVLSHDLFEGSLVRCAAVTDITVIEDAPFHSDVAASRAHRWIRGDWQLVPFLLSPRIFPTRAVNQWKMFDNLRRALVAPMSLGLLLLSLNGHVLSPWTALTLLMAGFCAGPVMGALAAFTSNRNNLARVLFYRLAVIDLVRAVGGGLWYMTQLLHQSLLALDAITRAAYRMLISHRNLLEWTTAEAAQNKASNDLAVLMRRHWRMPVIALVILIALLARNTPFPLLAALLCLTWAASALWIWLFSKPRTERAELTSKNQSYLEGIAHETWCFFERCVGPDDNYLPPDNLQITPHDIVAHRTSPTNIGMYLLSVACAEAFGWITVSQMISRIEATLATLAKLQRHHGHFLNWYDSQTLAPLPPLYVSTVDSGNFSGHLLAVAQACLALAEKATASQQDGQAEKLRTLARDCEVLAWQADFRILYHPTRHLFHIGLRVAEQQLDSSYYDLLASEARLTSLLAIAKGDVPVRHWAALGRPFFASGSRSGLRSWSGSMFEYLMPALILEEPHGSVLRSAGLVAVAEQIAFAEKQDVPWGFSESAYAASDHTLAYQYAPQGAPRLALRRTPVDELVVAPYATALAAQIAPTRALRNLKRLQSMAARGQYGFIEALDFSPARQSGSDRYTPVNTFMAHHQGMTIVSLANVLLNGLAQRWGMSNPHIEAVTSLLHEKAPRGISILSARAPDAPPIVMQQRPPGLLREVQPGANAVEPTHVLSNGRYSVTLRANGAGWSRWAQAGITRWRDDALRDACGSFLYLRKSARSQGEDNRERSSRPYSITQHPAPDSQSHYKSIFHSDRVCFDAEWSNLAAHVTVWVSPEDDIEFRQVELRNLTDQPVQLELISAFDVTMAGPGADEAHPAFSNLFVSAEWIPGQQALVFKRKPRLATERELHVSHFLVETQAQPASLAIQVDRHHWLGRNRAASRPRAFLEPPPPLPKQAYGADTSSHSVSLVTGLDPVCVLSATVEVPAHAMVQLTFATAASDTAATLHAVMDKYRQKIHVQRASLMSATLTGIRLRALGLSAENLAAIQFMTTALISSLTQAQAQQARSTAGAHQVCDRRLLWRFGISADRPIVLVSATTPQSLGLIRTLIQALRVWSWGGIACDLVVLNSEPASYLMVLQREIAALREAHVATSAAQQGVPCTELHVLRTGELSADERFTLRRLSRIHISADGRPFLHHIRDWIALHEDAFERRHATSRLPIPVSRGPLAEASTSTGNFDASRGEYRFVVHLRKRPPRPWINVIANAEFGIQISEAGSGYTWANNSRMNQLTGWSNDPVGDPPSEWFLLQDVKTLDTWSVSPNAWAADDVVYDVAHGQGYTSIRHRRGDLVVTASWCVDLKKSIKQIRLQITNQGTRTVRLRVVAVAEWMMGASRMDRRTVSTSRFFRRSAEQKMSGLLCTQNDRSGGFGDGTAFFTLIGMTDDDEDWTCDRREFFDARGAIVLPDHLAQQSGTGMDPCAALSGRVTLAPGDTRDRVFLMGFATSPGEATDLAMLGARSSAQQRIDEVSAFWNQLLGATNVKSPDPLFDVMVNRWLLYQTVSCRLWAKAGFYQAGGATGFRDQLQDAMALVWADPGFLRSQIVANAARQFEEGDVQHWWHSPLGAGVRTRFSDDLLWLPHAMVHYLRATGDKTLADEVVPFIDGAQIAEGAEDAYYIPSITDTTATIYEHCARAIDRSMRVGAHGLPLMGSGDWNDGMNRVGIEGRGESVWLGWFLCDLVAGFAPLARERGDERRAQNWQRAADGWKTALINAGWDGQWFKRAFFDDGQPLGSHQNSEGRIDLIAQSWAVLSGAAPAAMQRISLESMEKYLVDKQAGLIRLIDPPFSHAQPSAGYIQAYPPGVRENGGQYSHAGVWALMAQAKFSVNESIDDQNNHRNTDIPYKYFTYLSPAHRSEHPSQSLVYGVEPYVMAGDVCSQPPYVGRGGWSWYTGAAGWMHRAAIESIFGLSQDAVNFSFNPCLPSHWPGAEITLRRNTFTWRFFLVRATPAAALMDTKKWNAQLLLVGQDLNWAALTDSGCFVVPLPQIEVPTEKPQQLWPGEAKSYIS
jgi:cyclic beta-1,2-glucan synthetase